MEATKIKSKKSQKFFTKTYIITALHIIAWILVVTIIISTIVIIANEKLNTSFTSQGFNNLFEIFKFPLTLIATLIAVLTLRITFIRASQTQSQLVIMGEQINLVERQLLLSQRPELYLLPSEVSIFTSETSPKLEFQFENQPLNKIKLLNVGNGVAKNITLSVNFDYEEAIKLINSNIRNRFDLIF